MPRVSFKKRSGNKCAKYDPRVETKLRRSGFEVILTTFHNWQFLARGLFYLPLRGRCVSVGAFGLFPFHSRFLQVARFLSQNVYLGNYTQGKRCHILLRMITDLLIKILFFNMCVRLCVTSLSKACRRSFLMKSFVISILLYLFIILYAGLIKMRLQTWILR